MLRLLKECKNSTVIGIDNFTDYYDVSMTGYFLGTLIMLFAILTRDLLGTGEIAREFVIDRISI